MTAGGDRPPVERCTAHGKEMFTEDQAQEVVARINARYGGARRVKAHYSRKCGAWHVSLARGSASQERRRQAAEEAGEGDQ